MKFLAMSRRCPGATDAQVAAHATAEALAAFRLMRAGVFEQLYFSRDWRGAVLVLQVASREDAEAALATLPMVAEGVIGFDLYQLDPYDHYVRLFADEHKAAL
jgi:muconolactone delta-isomerase